MHNMQFFAAYYAFLFIFNRFCTIYSLLCFLYYDKKPISSLPKLTKE